MPTQADRPPLTLRAQLECTRTSFTVSAFEPGGVIYAQGDACDSVMYIESGRVRLAVLDPGGKEGICGLLGADAFLGEDAVAGHAARRQTAVAITATRVLVIATKEMSRLLHTQAAIADRFLSHILSRRADLETDLADLLLHSSERRLARTLVVLAECDSLSPCRCALPDISQGILAEMVGTTRSRVNHFIGKFKKLGYVENDGGVLRVTPRLVRALSDGNRDVSDRVRSHGSAVAV